MPLRRGNKLFFFGNGGSAADAQHLAAEFVNRYVMDRPPLPAIALTTDTSILTSVSNDISFSEIFAKQLKALGKEGDVAIGISTSGNSPNVIKAFEVAKEMGMKTVALTGNDGGCSQKWLTSPSLSPPPAPLVFKKLIFSSDTSSAKWWNTNSSSK